METLVSNLSPKRSDNSFKPGAFRAGSFLAALAEEPPTAPIETISSVALTDYPSATIREARTSISSL